MLKQLKQYVRTWHLVVLGAVASFMTAMPVHAAGDGLWGDVFTQIIYNLIIRPVAYILNGILSLTIAVSQYNNFNNESVVVQGWTAVRDTCNMFFILILLVIAIGTIVKWQKINFKNNMRSLILMALLINFSRTIVVFLIDFSQVITLTFLSAIKDSYQASAYVLLGLDSIANATSGAAVIGYLMSAIMLVVATIVLGILMLLFMMRIIVFWFLIIFAPAAFMASILPQTQKYYADWWSALGKQLAVGPVLAFMLWLIFTIVQAGPATNDAATTIVNDPTLANVENFVDGVKMATFIKYAIGIGMLLGSLKLAQMLGAVGGSWAVGMGEKVKGAGMGIAKRTGAAARRGGVLLATQPGATMGRVGGAVYRPVSVAAGGLETVGKLANWAGGKTGSAGLQRVGSRIQSAGQTVRADIRGRGERYDATMAATRERFNASALGSPIGRLQARIGAREQAVQAERVQAMGKNMGYQNMTYDELKSAHAAALNPLKRAAIAKQLYSDKHLMRLQQDNPQQYESVRRDIENYGGLTGKQKEEFRSSLDKDRTANQKVDTWKALPSAEGEAMAKKDAERAKDLRAAKVAGTLDIVGEKELRTIDTALAKFGNIDALDEAGTDMKTIFSQAEDHVVNKILEDLNNAIQNPTTATAQQKRWQTRMQAEGHNVSTSDATKILSSNQISDNAKAGFVANNTQLATQTLPATTAPNFADVERQRNRARDLHMALNSSTTTSNELNQAVPTAQRGAVDNFVSEREAAKVTKKYAADAALLQQRMASGVPITIQADGASHEATISSVSGTNVTVNYIDKTQTPPTVTKTIPIARIKDWNSLS